MDIEPPTQATQPNLKPKRFEHIKQYCRQHWKELALAIVVGTAASVMLYTLLLQRVLFSGAADNTKLTAHNAITSDTTASPLTGLQVPIAEASNPIIGVMIENHPDARPQTGLSQAGVVFETVAEGGITRFLVLFGENRPSALGPVRSLRPYYLDWAMGFDAVVVHAGGSAAALQLVADRHSKDINALGYGAPTFYRTSDRIAPHNLYTSGSGLDAILAKKGYTKSTFTPYTRTKKEQPAAVPTNTDIHINYSSASYAVEFKYDKSDNEYLRFLAGAPHIDRLNNQQISVKNLVVINMPVTYSGEYAVMPTIGSGSAIVFRDGVSYKGTWDKSGPSDQLRLLDASGKDMPLNPGSTWFAVVPVGQSVTY